MSKKRASTPPVRVMALSAITVVEALQPREGGCNPETVDEYAEAMKSEEEFPPLVVYRDEQAKHWLSEGFHRYHAALKAGLKKFACEIRKGDRGQALLNSCGSNRTHGLRRTNADKRRAIALLVAEFPGCSDRWIADAAGVSDKTVAAVRDTKPKQSNNHTAEFPQCDCLNNTPEQGTLFDCSEDGTEADVAGEESKPSVPQAARTTTAKAVAPPSGTAVERSLEQLTSLLKTLAEVEGERGRARVLDVAERCKVTTWEGEAGIRWKDIEAVGDLLTELRGGKQ